MIQFSGGASVHFQILSPESRKYFRNAIVMSGSVGNPWALIGKKDHLKNVFNIAKKLGKPQKSYDELVKFLKATPADVFNQFSVLVPEDPVKLKLAFGPIVERTISILSILGFLSEIISLLLILF